MNKRQTDRRLSPLERIGQGVERMIHPYGSHTIPAGRSWLPNTRVLDKRREIVIRLVSPEIDPRKIHIELEGNVLTLSGARGGPGVQGADYHAFKRSIVLPKEIDPRQISAACKGRILTIRVAKISESWARSKVHRLQAGSAKKVREIMTRDVKSVVPETSVRDAADLLRMFDIGSVPVCRNGEVVGILTDRDIAIRVAAQGADPSQTQVGAVMTPEAVTCSENDDLVDVEQLMSDEQIRRLPVVDRDRKLIGYLTMARIARSEHDLRSGHVLRGISQPGKPNSVEVATRAFH